MKAFIFVGEQGRGKSTKVFELIRRFRNKPLMAYDPNQEYVKHKNLIKGIPTKKQFVEIASKTSGHVIVFEEATSFFSNKGGTPMEIIELLVRNHHMKNVIIFNFHSLRTVPVDIMDFVQFITILHTNDRQTLIKNKFKDDPDLLKVFIDVNTKTYGTDKNRLTGVYRDERSKQFYHYSRVYSR